MERCELYAGREQESIPGGLFLFRWLSVSFSIRQSDEWLLLLIYCNFVVKTEWASKSDYSTTGPRDYQTKDT